MFSLDSLAFLMFVAVLLGVWYHTAPAHRWRVMLGANAVF